MDPKWYHVCWPRLTAKRVEPVVSISWASCYIILYYDYAIVTNIIIIAFIANFPIGPTIHNYCITTSMTPRVLYLPIYCYIFLFNVDVIILCRRLSESIMSVMAMGLSPRLLQVASTAEHVSLWGHSNRKWVTVSRLLQELQSLFGCFPLIWCRYVNVNVQCFAWGDQIWHLV